ncbi:MAG: hypothetical protein KGP28_06230 [Bdellovibrionales bacterium]|nr:hypothetical protein [Bdellovibrionales bacterium]
MKIIVPVLCSLILFLQNANSAQTRPLYTMGGYEVLVVDGDVEREPQLSHKTHELDDERSSPSEDPSPRTGSHFELKEFRTQSSMGRGSALSKLNPLSSTGFLKGNLQKRKDEKYYKDQFSYHDLLVPFLKSRQYRYLYGSMDRKHGPALVNSDYEFKGISDREFGFCWGFSTLNRFFGYLAFFEPNATIPHAYVRNGKEKNERWFRHYETIINDILSGHPRIIPGFSDFSEFSSVPEIEFYLKLKAAEAWALRAISTGSLGTFFSSTEELDEAGIDQLIRSLRARHQRGELPKILFTAADSRKHFGGSLDVHSVIATAVHLNPDGTGKIDLWDINFYFNDLIRSPKFLEIRFNASTGKRELHYPLWHEAKGTPEATARSSLLGQIRISPEEDSEMGQIVRNLKRFCGDPTTRQYCL